MTTLSERFDQQLAVTIANRVNGESCCWKLAIALCKECFPDDATGSDIYSSLLLARELIDTASAKYGGGAGVTLNMDKVYADAIKLYEVEKLKQSAIQHERDMGAQGVRYSNEFKE